MDADKRRLPIDQISETILASDFQVSNALSVGFLEKVYENALHYELCKRGLGVEQQKAIKVRYDGVDVGEYYADLLVENQVLVELKAVKSCDEIYMAQCLNYLKATGMKMCLLLNFAKPKIDIKRIVHNLYFNNFNLICVHPRPSAVP